MIQHQVAISMINYNSSDDTISCVRSILAYTKSNIDFQVIVVDNNSSEDEFEKLEALREINNLMIIRNKKNLGFSGGHMTAYKKANAEYILFQNNDTVFLCDYLSEMISFAKRKKNIGLMGGVMYDEKGIPQVSFGHHPSLSLKFFGLGIMSLLTQKKYLSRKSTINNPAQVEVISGASMFLKTSTFAEVGEFDLNYFLYCEEEDLALRLNKKGYNNWIIPSAKYMHRFEGKERNRYELLREFYISFRFYYRKHYPHWKYGLLKIYFLQKLLRRSFKSNDYKKLFWFVWNDANEKLSLRHQD